MTTLRLGTRGSPLALWQARWVRDRIVELEPGLTVELEVIRTTGDAILDRPLREVGGKAVFLKEIEEAMLDGRVDLAVHSLKDVPAFLPDGLELAAYPERADPRDALVVRPGLAPSLDALPRGARIGTSSLRRAAQLLARRDDLQIAPLRGNVGTRLERVQRGELDATLLALAGLARMGLTEHVAEAVDPTVLVPAIGQGTLGIETRSDDARTRDLVARLDHAPSRTASLAERALLERLEGDCRVPVGGHAVLRDAPGGAPGAAELELTGFVASVDGRTVVRRHAVGPAAEARALGLALADEILAAGGAEVLAALDAAG